MQGKNAVRYNQETKQTRMAHCVAASFRAMTQGVVALTLLSGCSMERKGDPIIPSVEYSARLKQQYMARTAPAGAAAMRNDPYLSPANGLGDARGRLHFVADEGAPAQTQSGAPFQSTATSPDPAFPPTSSAPQFETNMAQDAANGDYEVYRSSAPAIRDYNGPLSFGDPGVSASLWKESRGNNDIVRDQRAWQPMDLITIVVSENAQGSKEADTEVKSQSNVLAAIQNFMGYELDAVEHRTGLDPEAVVQASTQNNFKGEGETSRKDVLTAKISAMVVEVLPSGIIRVEGQKRIAINQEEQVMVISGLARPRDINSANEVDSSKIANMRIDYYGKGIVGEAQRGGWLSRLMRYIWPF